MAFMGTLLEDLDKQDPEEMKRAYENFGKGGAGAGGSISALSYNPNISVHENQNQQQQQQQQTGGFNPFDRDMLGNSNGGNGGNGNIDFSQPLQTNQYAQQLQEYEKQQLLRQLQETQAENQALVAAVANSGMMNKFADQNDNQERETRGNHGHKSHRRKPHYKDMSRLAKNIEQDVNNIGNPSYINSNIGISGHHNELTSKQEIIKETRKSYLSYLPNLLIDAFILLMLYIILSQPQVIGFFGNYIKILNPSKDCNYPFFGVIVYGLLLAVLYCLCQSARPHLINY